MEISHAVLSIENVKLIKHKLASFQKTPKGQYPKGAMRDLSLEFGTSNANISQIGRGVSWTGVL